ncbi:MAG: alpha-(1-_6)-mannopyranosyltransferase A [Herpetosiphon sp.]
MAYSLLTLAFVSVVLYTVGITWQYPLYKGLQIPGTTWPPLVNYSLLAGLRHAIIYGVLMAVYMLAIRLALRVPEAAVSTTSAIILISWFTFCAALIRAYPGDSLDMFDYVFRGRMQALFGASPLSTTPDAFRNLPFYTYLTWGDWVDAYGPLWEFPSALVARLVGSVTGAHLADYIIGYRLLAITLATASAWIMTLIIRPRNPQLIPATLVAWLWNPLLVISVAVGAHNDGMMIILILLAVLLFQQRRWTMGLVALSFAAHVKVTALLLAPVFGLWLMRRLGFMRAIRTAIVAVVLVLPVSWLLYVHYGGWQTLPRMVRERAILTYNSLANVVFEQLTDRWHWDATIARQTVIRGSTLCFLALAGVYLVRFYLRTSAEADDRFLWRMCIIVVLMYLIIGSFWFQSWYIVWPLALAALMPTDAFTRWTLPLLALGALWSNLLTDFLNQDPAHHLNGKAIGALMVGTLVAPAVIFIAASHLIRFVKGRRIYAHGVRSAYTPSVSD